MNLRPRILLSSLKEFESVVEPVLSLLVVRRICEIGVDKGIFTSFLANFCRTYDASYVGIDPSLSDASSPPPDERMTFLRRPSLTALIDLEPQDVYFVDGDHNYYTVFNELRLIFGHPSNNPVVFLHDVGWPWARRDQYCSPGDIPNGFRHPCSTTKGVVPGQTELQDWGFSGEGSDYVYAAATTEGGPRNGVLTAVEDAVAELHLTDYRLLVVPVVFGLGILYNPRTIPPAAVALLDNISRALDRLKPLLVKLEENRLDLFLNYLQVWRHDRDLLLRYSEIDKHSNDLQTRYNELLDYSNAQQRHYEALANHARDLQAAYDSLAGHAETLQATCDNLAEELSLTAEDRDFFARRIERIKRPWRWFGKP